MQNSITPMKGNLAVSTKCHTHLPSDPAIPLLGISPTETLAKIQAHAHMRKAVHLSTAGNNPKAHQ